MTRFIQRLREASEAKKSLLCVGLDPDPSKMPVTDFLKFNKAIVNATFDLAVAYKPNLGFYEALGSSGIVALERTVDYIRKVDPSMVIVADAKRGDMGATNSVYAKALFETWNFDAATVNCYTGGEALEPFLEYDTKGVFVLCHSSNPGASEFQDLQLSEAGHTGCGKGSYPSRLYELVARKAVKWNRNGNVGLVVGATYPEQLKSVRNLCPNMPILVPAVGAQKGDLKEAVLSGADGLGRALLVSSSRAILYASANPNGFAEAAREAAEQMCKSINNVLIGKGWGW